MKHTDLPCLRQNRENTVIVMSEENVCVCVYTSEEEQHLRGRVSDSDTHSRTLSLAHSSLRLSCLGAPARHSVMVTFKF